MDATHKSTHTPGGAAGWNFADMWERHAQRQPDAPALRVDNAVVSWSQLDRRADAIAAWLVNAGRARQAKIAQYLHNCPEYLESLFGIYKASMVPINTNYRYGPDELAYLWNNADAEVVVFHARFAATCARVRELGTPVKSWLYVEDGSGERPDWAVPYEQVAASGAPYEPRWPRSPDDLLILYTGGTTGQPKGVMWRQDDVIGNLDSNPRTALPPRPGWAEFDRRFTKPGPRHLAAAPLMHGSGLLNAMWTLTIGGSVSTSSRTSFRPQDVLDTVVRHRINSVSIVGDVFARPLVEALEQEPRRWDLGTLRVMISSGVMWSAATKEALVRHRPGLILVDTLGASEAMGLGVNQFDSATSAEPDQVATAEFQIGPNAAVLDDEDQPIAPGTGRVGRLAVRGRIPMGYYKDPLKSQMIFTVIDGQRWSVPGDWAEVLANGSILLHGRGSQCINTGGEKVFPEEIEEILKLHPRIRDAAVVGIPDPLYGQAVAAAIVADEPIDTQDVSGHVRRHLAGYKVPRMILVLEDLRRAPNGKLPYRELAEEVIHSRDQASI